MMHNPSATKFRGTILSTVSFTLPLPMTFLTNKFDSLWLQFLRVLNLAPKIATALTNQLMPFILRPVSAQHWKSDAHCPRKGT